MPWLGLENCMVSCYFFFKKIDDCYKLRMICASSSRAKDVGWLERSIYESHWRSQCRLESCWASSFGVWVKPTVIQIVIVIFFFVAIFILYFAGKIKYALVVCVGLSMFHSMVLIPVYELTVWWGADQRLFEQIVEYQWAYNKACILQNHSNGWLTWIMKYLLLLINICLTVTILLLYHIYSCDYLQWLTKPSQCFVILNRWTHCGVMT